MNKVKKGNSGRRRKEKLAELVVVQPIRLWPGDIATGKT